jgi:magnesium-transporting ATPase (P-type)
VYVFVPHCDVCLRIAALQVPARSTDSYHEDNNGPQTDGLVFMGLISLVDPPREGVLEAVNK